MQKKYPPPIIPKKKRVLTLKGKKKKGKSEIYSKATIYKDVFFIKAIIVNYNLGRLPIIFFRVRIIVSLKRVPNKKSDQ